MDNTVDAKTVKSWISDDDEIAFIDVREIGQHAEGHPFFSISIPFSTFEINIERLLPNKNVRLVLFDDNNGISELAYKQAKALGYSKILILKEGVKGWLGAKFKLFDGINVPYLHSSIVVFESIVEVTNNSHIGFVGLLGVHFRFLT